MNTPPTAALEETISPAPDPADDQPGRSGSRRERRSRSRDLALGRQRDAPVRLRRLLVVADLHAVVAALLGAAVLGHGLRAGLPRVIALVPVWLLLARAHGLYSLDERRLCHRTTDDIPGLFNWVIFSTALSALIIAPLSITQALIMAGLAFLWAGVMRRFARELFQRVTPPERALIVGSHETAQAIARKLELERRSHLLLVRRLAAPPRTFAPWLGPHRELLLEAIASDHVERVIVAQQEFSERELSPVVAICRELDLRLTVIPADHQALGTGAHIEHLAEMPLIEFGEWAPARSVLAAKRAVDVVLGAVALAVLSPLMALTALAVKLESRGPVLFRQVRAGRDGRPFTILKFRTMDADADQRLDEVVDLERLSEPVYKLPQDPRVTRLGRLLRRTSIDELPQLLNVLRGSMSLVGPRPEDVRLVDRWADGARVKLAMRPGITGPMQVFGRGDLSFAERLAVERDYIDNYSLARDLTIMFRTLSVVFTRHGAY